MLFRRAAKHPIIYYKATEINCILFCRAAKTLEFTALTKATFYSDFWRS
jgi:hypothetical protein